tara:strand:- start:44 stop:607 length:564 start_codon:yes stop_codon:yes gene_type:complete
LIPKKIINRYLYVYNDLGGSSVELKVLLNRYMAIQECDEKTAIEVFETEMDNYTMKSRSGISFVTLIPTNDYQQFSRIDSEDRCLAQTKGSNYLLRCRQSAKIDSWCNTHERIHTIPVEEEVKIPAKEQEIPDSSLLLKIEEGTDLETLLKESQKLYRNRHILFEISKLELEISKIELEVIKLKKEL